MINSKHHWTSLLAVCVAMIALSVSYSSIFGYAPDVVRHFGTKERNIGYSSGLMIGVYYLGALLNILWGHLSDRWGRRPILIASLFLMAVTNIGFGAAGSFKAAVVWRLAMGAVDARGVLFATVADLSDTKSRDLNMGLLIIAIQLGFVLGPLTAASLIDVPLLRHPPVNLPFLLCATPTVFLCICACVFLQAFLETTSIVGRDVNEVQPLITSIEDEEKDKTRTLPKESAKDKGKGYGETLLPIDPNKQEANKVSKISFPLVVIVFAMVTFKLTAKSTKEALTMWGGLMASHGGAGLSSFALGFVASVPCLAVIPVALLVCPWTNAKIGNRDASIVGAVASALFAALIPVVKLVPQMSPLGMSATLSCLYGAQRAASMFLFQSLLLLMNGTTPPHLLGIVNGVAMGLGCLCNMGSSIGTGAIVSANDSEVIGSEPTFLNYGMAFLVMSALYIVISLVLLLVPRGGIGATTRDNLSRMSE